MITTNLTLTNGATSDIPFYITGVRFDVDSKLTVNSAVVFPLVVAIGTSEIMGIDFDETLYSGDFTETIVMETLGGFNNLEHTVNIVDTSVAPSAVTNLEATDNQIGQVTITFTNATGTPAPTYNLLENDVEVATDIYSGYVHSVVAGDYSYKVVSTNVAGSEESAVTAGKSLPPLAEPVPIIDLEASDDEYNQVTITFTPAVGNPTPTQDLYEDDIEVATNIPDGYTHAVLAGTRSYKVKSFNSEALAGIDSNSDDGISLDALSPPSEILDFAITDNEREQATITFTPSVGNPTPTHDLYRDNIEVAVNIDSGYVYHSTEYGVATYRIDAENSQAIKPSNDDIGYILPPLSIPTAIDDFVANDGYDEITATYTRAVGHPTPQHRLLEGGIAVVENFQSGATYVPAVNGVHTYMIEAHNSEGTTPSNPDDAESLVPLAPPSTINDFVATGDIGVVRVDFTDATGNPEPTYDLYEDTILLVADVAKNTNYTTTVGVHEYFVRVTNSQDSTDSNTDGALVTAVPSEIVDFAASDGEEGNIIMTFTPATGTPRPHHNLFEGGIEIAVNIPSGYIHIIDDATNTYRVDAINVAGTQPSNDNDGTSVPGAPALTPPTEIVDFEASDEDELTITMNFTNSTGNPAPTHALFENSVAVVGAEDIADGYIHTPAVVGTYTYRVDAINSEGTEPSNDDDGTCTDTLSLPSEIDDFEATDGGVNLITMSFTPATGSPTPVHNLFEDNLEIASAIPSGYEHIPAVNGTYTYRVDAVNSEGTVSSNDDDGTSYDDIGGGTEIVDADLDLSMFATDGDNSESQADNIITCTNDAAVDTERNGYFELRNNTILSEDPLGDDTTVYTFSFEAWVTGGTGNWSINNSSEAGDMPLPLARELLTVEITTASIDPRVEIRDMAIGVSCHIVTDTISMIKHD